MSRLRVLYVVPQGEIGGAERFLDSIVGYHDAASVVPSVLAMRDGPWLDQLRARGIEANVLPHARLRELPRLTPVLYRFLRREHIDVVHSWYGWCHSLVTPAAAMAGCKRVWFHHGPIGRRRWQGWQHLIPADLLLLNSYFLLSRLRQTLYSAKRTEVVHYAIDADRIRPDPDARQRFRRAWRISDDTVAIGIVGFIDSWKGQDLFLRAGAQVLETRRNVRLFVVGGPRGGPAAHRCEAVQRELHDFVDATGIGDSVAFTGHVDVLDGALDGLDVVVHASTEPEPFGMVILEAMAKQTPVIASGEGGPCEIIDDGRSGILFEPRATQSLVSAMLEASDDRSVRERLGTCARSEVAKRFTPEKAAARLEALYAG